ncbi:MAG: M24 family metallopeptidase, partial [Lachnospiraceae bacterium]|nr:M24 family metallopeptidase [Lachnospiraceae bacterium]
MIKLGRNDSCWCGSGRKYKACHMAMDEKIHRYELEGHIVPPGKILKTEKQIQGIRESSVINMAVLDAVGEMIGPGVSTQQIDDVVTEVTARMGGIAAPLNYEGFPKSVCTSINEVVCHGIPSKDVILKDGDIVNVDVSTLYKGY